MDLKSAETMDFNLALDYMKKEYAESGGEEKFYIHDAIVFMLRYKKLLEERQQEIGHWISLENCSNSGVYCSECHTKVFDSYPFKKKFSYFCPHCGTRMEGETERR